MAADGSSTPPRAPHLNIDSKPLNSRKRRQILEAACDRLLAAVEAILADLDAIDGDPDFEPSLGAPEARMHCSELFGRGGFLKAYATELNFDQRAWALRGGRDDREMQCEDEGACTGDDEPWLNPPQGPGSHDFSDREEDAVVESHSQGGRMLCKEDGRRVYWQPGVDGATYDPISGPGPETAQPEARQQGMSHQSVGSFFPARAL